MAYNPFLSMGEPAGAAGGAEVLNPFMMTDAEPAAFSGDNPFATSNPFSDLGGGFEPAAGDEVPTDVFGADPPVDGARLFDAVPAPLTRAAEELFAPAPPTKPTELALRGEQPSPPGRPLPPETHDLILSVTGQMELASSHLLDRIPPTRTPSPVSARDIHSPSPTPEPDLPHDPPAPDSFDINRNRPLSPAPAPPALTPSPVTPAVPPARPPPARPAAVRPPPPRPAPPPPPPPAAPRAAPPPDDINLFDAPAPPALKPTKEDILSLYSAPKKEERQIDFLSDDILEDLTADGEVMQQNFGSSAPAAPGADVASAGAASLLPGEVSPPHGAAEPMDCSEPPLPEIRSAPAPAPDDRSPFAIATPDMESQRPAHASADVNPFESVGAQETTFSDSTNVFGISPGAEDAFACPGEDAFGGCAADAGGAVLEAGPFGGGDTWGGAGADAGWDGASEAMAQDAFPESQDAFDAFSAKFDSTTANHVNTGAWGDGGPGAAEVAEAEGFEAEAFDPFLSMSAPPPAPAATPRLRSQGSADSTDDTFSVFIRPKAGQGEGEAGLVPALAPPPRPHALPDSPRANPFDSASPPPPLTAHHPAHTEGSRRSSAGSGGTPPTPLFDEDVSQPLEDFPRTKYTGPGWEMHLRQPNKKKITGQRFWKKVWVRVVWAGDNPVVQLSEGAEREPFQELPLQACYSVSDVGAQQFDQFGKIFTVKLQYVFYKERPGVRPGQVTKAERITSKLSQFAAYAIQGDYQGVKEFGSDLRKLGLPVEHAPQVSQLFKLGSLAYEDVKQFSCCVEEALFRLSAHRDRALTYKMEEVQVTAVDELHVEQDAEGSVLRQIARVRLFFLGFLSGMPDVELGVNDLRRQGKEVVGRHDIIPVVTEEWIRVEEAEFHACVQPEEFTKTQIIKFKPPDACYIELMRFRVRPPKNRELPLQLKAVWCVTGNKVELRADVLVPGFASRKLGQVPCEDVAIRFPIPECWIYLFRVEKHFRYGSVKSAHRRTGKIKGIERFLGAVDTLQESLIEVTSGQAKYEHQHRAIVWRMPRLPKEGQGAYTTHNLVCRMALTSYDQVPAELARWAHVEFTMPATQVSHVTVRSVSLQNHDNDPPEKYVRYLARHEYIVGIERTTGQSAPAYALAATTEPPPPAAPPAPAPLVPQPPSSDSDSD